MALNEVLDEVFGPKRKMSYYTTKPTTGLSKGDLMLLFHGSRPIIGVCSSAGGKTIKMITLVNKTVGRLSNG